MLRSFKFKLQNYKTWSILYCYMYCNKAISNFSMSARKKHACFLSTSHTTKAHSRVTTESRVNQDEEDIGYEVPFNPKKKICPIPSKYKIKTPFSDIVASLLSCYTVEEQINKFCDMLKLSKEEIQERIELSKYLEDNLKTFFPGCRVFLIGSSINGFGLKGCDIDMSLDSQCDESLLATSLPCGKLPSVDEVEDGSVPVSLIKSFKPLYQLRFARHVLLKYTYLCPIYLLKGRCPILQFPYGDSKLSCDLSLGNSSAIDTTKLQIVCSMIDERVVPITLIVNYWAKHNHFIQAQKFKSYAFSIMTIHFLQTRNPPILPPLKDILKLDFFKHSDVLNYDFSSDLKKIRKSENKESVSELLREFFFFYLFFDFDQVICPLTGANTSKKSLKLSSKLDINSFQVSHISIQDPVNITWNVTTGVIFKYCLEFLSHILAICKLLQDDKNWQTKKAGSWGLAELFTPHLFSKSTKETTFSINIPYNRSDETNLSICQIETILNTLLSIFTKGLMFDCILVKNGMVNLKVESIKTGDLLECCKILNRYSSCAKEQDSSSHLCSIHCIVYNCWKGRNLYSSKNIPKEEFLEAENSVTKQILSSSDNKTSSQFLCEFYKTDQNSVITKFICSEDTHFPQQFIIFMCEYISLAMQKLSK